MRSRAPTRYREVVLTSSAATRIRLTRRVKMAKLHARILLGEALYYRSESDAKIFALKRSEGDGIVLTPVRHPLRERKR